MQDYRHYFLPPQKVSDSAKTEQWRKQCVDAIQNMASYNRESKSRKHVNRKLHNGEVIVDDYKHILDPLQLKGKHGGVPAKIQNQNRMRSKIERLKGEELRRPDNFRVVAVNGEALSVKEQKKKSAIFESIQAMLLKELGLDSSGQQPPAPEAIERYFKYEYTDIREITGNQVLNYLKLKQKFKRKFSEGFENALILAEEIYYCGIVAGEPTMRVVRPESIDYDKNLENPFIQNGQWVREERWMTIGSILDEYGEYLKESEVALLDSGQIGNFIQGAQPGYAYPFKETGADGTGSRFSSDLFSSNGTPQGHIYVCNVVWKSMKKIGFLTYIDENGEAQETMVDEDFTLDSKMKSEGWELDWQWINEVWQGTKIGNSLYVNIEPLPNQCRSMTNPSECLLPYIGCVYNGGISLIDLMKPHSYLYDMLWCKLEMELAKAKGGVLKIDIAQMPKSEGFDMEKWMYYADNLGFLVVNTADESENPQQPTRHDSSKPFEYFDRGMSATVVQYIQFMDKLDALMGDVSGINNQRLGDTSASETLGGIQTAIQNSSYVTEPWFFQHDELREAVMTYMLELAKLAYIDGKTTQYFVDDVYTEMLKVDGELFNDSDYGVFLSNSSQDAQIKEELKELMRMQIQKGEAKFSDIIAALKSNSISDIESRIAASERRAEEQAQAQFEQEQETARMQSEAMLTNGREQREWEGTQKELDRQNKTLNTQITALGMGGDADVNQDGQPDIVGQMKIVMDQQKLVQKQNETDQKIQLEREKIVANDYNDKLRLSKEMEMQDKEHKLKEKEIAAKIQIAKARPKNTGNKK
jgi:hypothetical protein